MNLVRDPFLSSSPSLCVCNAEVRQDSLNAETLSYKLIPRLHLIHFPTVVSSKNSAEKNLIEHNCITQPQSFLQPAGGSLRHQNVRACSSLRAWPPPGLSDTRLASSLSRAPSSPKPLSTLVSLPTLSATFNKPHISFFSQILGPFKIQCPPICQTPGILPTRYTARLKLGQLQL